MKFFEDSDLEYYFPLVLEEEMNLRGLSPSDFEECGVVSASSKKSYLDGDTLPTLRTAAKIASFLSVSLDHLCGFDDIPINTTSHKDISRKAPWL